MMKSNSILIVLVTLGILFFSLATKAQTHNDLTIAELKGPVKSVSTRTYMAADKSGEIVKGNEIRSEITNFTNKGMIAEDWAFFDGHPVKKVLVTFDDKGNKKELVFYKPDGSISFKTNYLYNNKGELIEEKTSHSNNISNIKKTYSYNADGNLVEKNLYDAKGELKNRYTYKYDSHKNETEACSYITGGILIKKSIKNYDSNGRLLETKAEMKSDKYSNKYTYDGRGNIIQDDEYENGSLSLKSTYKIDYKGTKVEECSYYPNGKIKNKKIYDKEGSITEDTDYNDLGAIKFSETIKYMYDMYGNWRTKTMTLNSKITISERSLEYY